MIGISKPKDMNMMLKKIKCVFFLSPLSKKEDSLAMSLSPPMDGHTLSFQIIISAVNVLKILEPSNMIGLKITAPMLV